MVAECLELADEVSASAVLVDALGVEVGAEVVVAGGGVGEEVPDDDEDRAGDRDEGFELAAAFDESAVALAEERVGLGGGGGGLAEGALEVGVALPGLAGRLLGPDWIVRGESFAQETRWPGVGNWAMSRPSSAMSTWAVRMPMPGDLVEPLDGWQRGVSGSPGGQPGSVADGRLGGGDLRDQLVDAERERVDVRGQAVDLVEQQPGELGVVVVEAAGERLDQLACLTCASGRARARRGRAGRALPRSAPRSSPGRRRP